MMQSPSRSTLPITSLTLSISLQQIHSSIFVVMATEQFEKVHLTNKKLRHVLRSVRCNDGQVYFTKLENLYTCTGFPCTVNKFVYNKNTV